MHAPNSQTKWSTHEIENELKLAARNRHRFTRFAFLQFELLAYLLIVVNMLSKNCIRPVSMPYRISR